MERAGCVTDAGLRRAAEMLLAGQRVEVAELLERHMRGHKKL